MNGRNSYLIVGVFVAFGIVALVTLSIMFAGGRATEALTRYTVLFQRDISGLTVGAPVRYLGVAVGEVRNMRLTAAAGPSVRVDLEVLESTPVNSATYASLAFQGVTGVAFISLAADPDIPATALLAGEFEYPVIPARNVGFAALLSEGPEIGRKVALLLDRANHVLDEENRAALSRSLKNIDLLTESLVSADQDHPPLAEQVHLVLEELDGTLTQFRSVLDQAEPDLLKTLTALSDTSASLAGISERLDLWLSQHDQEVNEFIRDGLGQAPELIDDTRAALRELEKLLIELRKNPSQVIFQPQADAVVVEP